MSKFKPPKIRSWRNVEKAVGEVAVRLRARGQLTDEYDAKVEELRPLITEADRLNNERVAIERAVEEFVIEHQDEMEGSTMQLATGEVQVAWKPPSVVCVDGEEETLKVLKRKKLDQFIRVKESVNKNAIRDAKLDPKRLESFKIEIQTSQRVDIKPVSVKLAEAKPPRSAA